MIADAYNLVTLDLDVFAVGEHHRGDFAVSAPAVVLAAMAEHTRDIRLSSAVKVLTEYLLHFCRGRHQNVRRRAGSPYAAPRQPAQRNRQRGGFQGQGPCP
jgi:hypothetical protein